MLKKYNIKKYIPFFILIIVFLSCQVFLNTEIPKFMAKNINIGIMQGGITEPIFEKMDDNTYNLLLNISENKQLLLNSYKKENGIYILKDNVDKKEIIEETSKDLTKITNSTDEKVHISVINKVYKDMGIDKSTEYIKINSLKMLSISIIASIFAISAGFTVSYMSGKISMNLRRALFHKVEYFSSKNLEKFGIASLITRTTSDISKLQNSLNFIFRISILAPLTLIIASIQAYTISSELMKVIVYLSISLITGLLIAAFFLTKIIALGLKLIDELNNIVREILTGKRVIRAFNKQDYENNKFEKVNKKTKTINLAIDLIMAVMDPFAGFILNISSVIIVYYVSKIIPTSNIGVGSIIAFIQYTVQIMISFLMLTGVFFMIPTAYISFKRIDEVISEDITIKSKDNAVKIENIDTFEFKNVYFKYDNSSEYVLSDINFKLKKGDSLGIIGSTGSGKSTISKLVLRFLDITKGNIIVNDKYDIRDIELSNYRDKISYTPQVSKVLSGTVLDNVAYNDDNMDIERAKTAINMACADEFADLDLEINQAGANLSGGQKQRIQIARAIYKNPDIIIFDDSFSALDNKTDKKIRENLKNLFSTKIVISQKISTIKDFDKILVLNEGLVVGFGTHTELLENCKIYKEIYDSQIGGIDG